MLNLSHLIEKANFTQNSINSINEKFKQIPDTSIQLEEFSFSFEDIESEINNTKLSNDNTINARIALLDSLNKYKEALHIEIDEIASFNNILSLDVSKLKTDFFNSVPLELFDYNHIIRIPSNQFTNDIVLEMKLPYYLHFNSIIVFSKSDVVQQVRLEIIEKLLIKDPQIDNKNYHSSRVQIEKTSIKFDISQALKLFNSLQNIK